jgi:hypothetical protein
LVDILGLYSAEVLSAPDPNSGSEYRVILGYDYEPCFKPEDLIH